MKNLVMGAATGYGWNDLEPFVVSCRKNCPDADLVLFVDEVSAFTEKNLTRWGGVQLQPIPEHLKSKLIIDARWEMYKIFIESHPEYEKIFVTDTRDVIFQKDLFSTYAAENFLVYATEADSIRDDVNNSKWLKHFVGEDEYQKIADKIIICCGTVYGTRTEMNIFFDCMIEILKRSTAWGDEQAGMNWLVHNNFLPIENLIESGVYDGEILTAGIAKKYGVDAGKILRGDGKAPAVVHQWNRKEGMFDLVDRIYREQITLPDENFLDFRSALDQVFCSVQRKNYSTATKLFIEHIFYAENLNPYANRFLELYKLMVLQKYDSDAEILFCALQKVLVKFLSVAMSLNHFEKLYLFLTGTEKDFLLIPEFKSFIRTALATFADSFYKANRPDLGEEYLRRLLEWRD